MEPEHFAICIPIKPKKSNTNKNSSAKDKKQENAKQDIFILLLRFF